jgi:hypothetical protein
VFSFENLCMELVEERVTPAPPRLEPIVPNFRAPDTSRMS